MATPATLVSDASLNKRIATELKRRGRDAVALSELQLRHARDPELLYALAEHFADQRWVLLTADDNLPAAHADVVAEVQATIATVDPRRTSTYTDDEDAWRREVAHRLSAHDGAPLQGLDTAVFGSRWTQMGTTWETFIRPASIPRPPQSAAVPAGPPNGLTSHPVRRRPCETADVAFGTLRPRVQTG